MSRINYLDFDLLIERSGGGYAVRVLCSPIGSAVTEFDLPFSDLEVENLVLRMGHKRQNVRHFESPEMKTAKIFGGRLFEAVFGGQVYACFRSSLDRAVQQGAGLRIRLRLAHAPELADLPWEYLYDSSFNRFLALSSKTPIIRFLELPEPIRPLGVKPPLRVLVMISTPSEYRQLDMEREWTKLKEALGNLEKQVLMAPERLGTASLAALRRRLRQGEYHIFHFVGHGGFDSKAQDGVLVLEDAEKRGNPVSGQHLGMLLSDHYSLRLVILNACEGARSSRTDPFAGTAQSLVQQGIPAVIAMQFPVTDEAAITFSNEFYSTLADGYPVDAALTEARRAVFAQGNEVEWGTPVLYLRAPDGCIFNVEQVSDVERRQGQIAILHHEAEAAMLEEDWDAAIEKLQALLALDSTYAGAGSRLRQARQNQQLVSLYVRGQKHYEAGHWSKALAYLRQAQNIRSNYKDVGALITAAEKKMRMEQTFPSLQRNLSRLEAIFPRSWATLFMLGRWLKVIVPIFLVLLLLICSGAYLASIYPKPTPTAGSTMVPTPTRTPTSAASPTVKPTPTVTPSATPVPQMVHIPAGVFTQGSTSAQIDAVYQECKAGPPEHVKGLCWRPTVEQPQHRVYLDEFYIDKHEITNAQYGECVKAQVCAPPSRERSNTRSSYFGDPTYAEYSVIYVTWHDASTYCQWTGKRLPTEAEWEKAARGEYGMQWPWGDSFSPEKANVRPSGVAPDTGDTFRVGSYPEGASPCGAMDMTGNVSEWVADWYDKQYYERAPLENPKGPSSGKEKVIRGGSWNSNFFMARPTHRAHALPNNAYFDIGFRCVRSPNVQ